MIRYGPLAVEDIDAATPAEIVFRPATVPFVEGQQLLPLTDEQRCFWYLYHHCIPLDAERAIAGGEFLNGAGQGETHAAAVT